MKKVKGEIENPQDIITLLKTQFQKDNTSLAPLQKAISQNCFKSKNLKTSIFPYFSYSFPESIPGSISLFLITTSKGNAFKFFFDMMTHWLIPGKELLISSIQMSHFSFLKDQQLTLTESKVEIESLEDFEQVKANISILEKELFLGLRSKYYAMRILEFKGGAVDAKITLLQEQIAHLISRFARFLDHELFAEMQYLIVTSSEEFKKKRASRHLGRIIVVHYLFRKQLRQAVQQDPSKRHLMIKIVPSYIQEQSKSQPVLSILIGVNFLQDQEVFEERHVMSAIHHYIPHAKAVKNSFFSSRRGDETICTLYVELEKSHGEPFSFEERRILQQRLPSDLKDCIEHLLHPVFMPRNDEEIMRNILMLSSQIKYIDDLPQVVISFDKQTHTDLYFNVILVQLRKPDRPAIHELFKKAKGQTPLIYIHDRSKITGSVRRYEKEASVFFLKISKDQFLRRDHSIDLNKARQSVLKELSKVVGEMRDFNGGMISTQNEAFLALKKEMEGIPYNEIFLENFYYSLTPDAMRTVLDLSLLKKLYLFIIETIKASYIYETFGFKVRTCSDYVFAVVKTEDKGMREYLGRALRKFKHNHSLVSSYVVIYDIDYMGYLFLSEDMLQQEAFCYFVQTAMLLREPKLSSGFYPDLIRPDYED